MLVIFDTIVFNHLESIVFFYFPENLWVSEGQRCYALSDIIKSYCMIFLLYVIASHMFLFAYSIRPSQSLFSLVSLHTSVLSAHNTKVLKHTNLREAVQTTKCSLFTHIHILKSLSRLLNLYMHVVKQMTHLSHLHLTEYVGSVRIFWGFASDARIKANFLLE